MNAGELPFIAMISFILSVGTTSVIPQLPMILRANANSSSETVLSWDIAEAPKPSIIGVFGITSTTFALGMVRSLMNSAEIPAQMEMNTVSGFTLSFISARTSARCWGFTARRI